MNQFPFPPSRAKTRDYTERSRGYIRAGQGSRLRSNESLVFAREGGDAHELNLKSSESRAPSGYPIGRQFKACNVWQAIIRSAVVFGSLSCCRFHGHQVKVFLELEDEGEQHIFAPACEPQLSLCFARRREGAKDYCLEVIARGSVTHSSTG